MSRHTLGYDLYLRSPVWRARRWWWWLWSDRRCERCGTRIELHGGRGRRGLTVHHRNYRRLYRERRRDVELVCWECHQVLDRWRRQARR